MSESQPELQPKGLSLEHYQELNSMPKGRSGRYEELRRQYCDDPLALWQLDRFDPSSEFAQKIGEADEAHRTGDTEKIVKLKKWFNAHRKKFGLEQI